MKIDHYFLRNSNALRGIITFELRRVTRIWRQTLIPPLMNMTLYFLIFGHFVGSRIPEIQGYSYMAFLVPGLIMMAIIMESYNGSVFPFFMSKFHRNIEEILIAPVSNCAILLGFTLSGMLRGLIIGLLVACIAGLFHPMMPEHPIILIIAAICASTFFCLVGFLNALFAKNFEDISIVPTFILTPLVYLGGVFYSTDQLSPFWQKVSMLNPIVYIIKIFRYGFLGLGGAEVLIGLPIIVGLILIVFIINITLLRKGVRLKT